VKIIAVVTSLLAGGALLFGVSSARAQDDSRETPDVVPDAPPAPTTSPPSTPPKRNLDEPPAPAAAHTEYEGAPPTLDQEGTSETEGSEGAAKPKSFPRLHPFASIVGGAKIDVPIQGPGLDAASRASAIMLSDFGVRGDLLPWISFESELMANGGAGLHGTSVFEGQASLQVRKQVIHLARDWWSVEVGRVIDEASVDYFSNHVADVFLEDDATRDALLFDGFNLGNGVRGTAEIAPGLRLGLAANAGNPTSSSAILEFGGSFPPYSAIFYQAASATRTDTNGYPDDEFQSYVATPSILYKNKFVEAKTALQYFLVNPGASEGGKPVLRGYNTRFNIAAHINDNMFMPYLNLSYGKNDTINLNNTNILSADKYTGISYGLGLDFNYEKKFGNYNGFGVQFVEDQSQVGPRGVISRNRYTNVGTTYWLAPMLALGLRYAQYTLDELDQPANLAHTPQSGLRSVLLTLRLVL
jgi:hypothetical protein